MSDPALKLRAIPSLENILIIGPNLTVITTAKKFFFMEIHYYLEYQCSRKVITERKSKLMNQSMATISSYYS